MTNPALDLPAAEMVATPRPPTLRFDWLREPLLHFVLLGGILFAVDHFVISRSQDPNTIVLSAEVDQEAKATFRATRNRDPNPEELEALRRVWLDNEVLYREGLALQVDKGDEAIRERVIFKALSVVDSTVKLPKPDDATLKSWFEQHRQKYDEPPRFDFEEAALSGDTSEAAVRAFVKDLSAGTPGDAKAGLRVFKARPRENVVQSYGQELADALDRAPLQEWQAQHTRDGWRAIRVTAKTPAKRAVYEKLRGVVLHDWTDTVAAEQRTAAVRALAKKYRIQYEAGK